MKLVSIAVLLVALAPLTAGCGNKDSKAKAEESSSAGGAAGKPKTIEDKGRDFLKGMNDIASKNADDCDKFGSELEKYLKDNKSTFVEVMKHVDKLSPEEKKKFDEATGGNKKDDPMDKTMDKCKGNKNVDAAMTVMMETALENSSARPKPTEPDKTEVDKKEDDKKPE